MSDNNVSRYLADINKRYLRVYCIGMAVLWPGILMTIGAIAWSFSTEILLVSVGFIALGVLLLIFSKTDQFAHDD